VPASIRITLQTLCADNNQGPLQRCCNCAHVLAQVSGSDCYPHGIVLHLFVRVTIVPASIRITLQTLCADNNQGPLQRCCNCAHVLAHGAQVSGSDCYPHGIVRLIIYRRALIGLIRHKKTPTFLWRSKLLLLKLY